MLPQTKTRKQCRFRVGDIVKVAARPENPCEVMVTEWSATAEEWVLFIIDKRTLKGDFVYDDGNDNTLTLVRRPEPDKRRKGDCVQAETGARRPKNG